MKAKVQGVKLLLVAITLFLSNSELVSSRSINNIEIPSEKSNVIVSSEQEILIGYLKKHFSNQPFEAKIAVARTVINKSNQLDVSIRDVLKIPEFIKPEVPFTSQKDNRFSISEEYSAVRSAFDGLDPTHATSFYIKNEEVLLQCIPTKALGNLVFCE